MTDIVVYTIASRPPREPESFFVRAKIGTTARFAARFALLPGQWEFSNHFTTPFMTLLEGEEIQPAKATGQYRFQTTAYGTLVRRAQLSSVYRRTACHAAAAAGSSSTPTL